MKTAEKGGKKSREKSHDTFATRPRGLSILKKKNPPFWNNESLATHATDAITLTVFQEINLRINK